MDSLDGMVLAAGRPVLSLLATVFAVLLGENAPPGGQYPRRKRRKGRNLQKPAIPGFSRIRLARRKLSETAGNLAACLSSIWCE
jgi:hypothetical protein